MNRSPSKARRMLCRAPAALTAGLVLAAAGPTAAQAVAPHQAFTPIKVNRTNWSGAAGFGSRGPAWYKDRSGVVHLQGALTQISNFGAAADTLGTLPGAARPERNVFTIVHTFKGTYADLEIARDGQLNLINPAVPLPTDFSFVSLEGITYRPSGRVTPIKLNTFNWSANARFGSGRPTWYKDRAGVVHLQGAVKTAGRKCAIPCLVGTLPASAAPDRAVATVVHTFSGTYAGLTISTSGQIFTIPPRPPAVLDYTFVSLEGVTFRPSGRATAIRLNRTHWETAPGFGRRTPAWFTDRSGVVHLSGALLQTNGSGTGVDRLGTLPAAARPSRNVFTIVLTNGGAYADLEIHSNGQITVIAPRSPAVTDSALVSLESITYRR